MQKEELLAVIDSLFHAGEHLDEDLDYVRGLRNGYQIALESIREYIEKNWP